MLILKRRLFIHIDTINVCSRNGCVSNHDIQSPKLKKTQILRICSGDDETILVEWLLEFKLVVQYFCNN